MRLRPLNMPDMAETDWFDHLMEQLPGQASQSNHSPFVFYKKLSRLVENPESRIVILFNCLEKNDPKHLQAYSDDRQHRQNIFLESCMRTAISVVISIRFAQNMNFSFKTVFYY